MRNIRVTFRAVFEFPTGLLNPMNVRIPGPQPVEVFQVADNWLVRELSTPRRNPFLKLGKMVSADQAKEATAFAFLKCMQPWQIWGIPPGETKERIILPDEIWFHNGKHQIKEADDYTHLIDGKAPGRIPPAMCGAQVKASSFISLAANLPPSCKKCAEVYQKEWVPRQEAVKK